MTGVLQRRRDYTHRGRRPSIRKGERSQKKPTLVTSWPWTSSLQTRRHWTSLFKLPNCGTLYGSPSRLTQPPPAKPPLQPKQTLFFLLKLREASIAPSCVATSPLPALWFVRVPRRQSPAPRGPDHYGERRASHFMFGFCTAVHGASDLFNFYWITLLAYFELCLHEEPQACSLLLLSKSHIFHFQSFLTYFFQTDFPSWMAATGIFCRIFHVHAEHWSLLLCHSSIPCLLFFVGGREKEEQELLSYLQHTSKYHYL